MIVSDIVTVSQFTVNIMQYSGEAMTIMLLLLYFKPTKRKRK